MQWVGVGWEWLRLGSWRKLTHSRERGEVEKGSAGRLQSGFAGSSTESANGSSSVAGDRADGRVLRGCVTPWAGCSVIRAIAVWVEVGFFGR
jgi:hypothetical protein